MSKIISLLLVAVLCVMPFLGLAQSTEPTPAPDVNSKPAINVTAEWGQQVTTPAGWSANGPSTYIMIYNKMYYMTLGAKESLGGLVLGDQNDPNYSADDAVFTLVSQLGSWVTSGELPWYKWHNLEQYNDQPFYKQIIALTPLQQVFPALVAMGFNETVDAAIKRYSDGQAAASSDTAVSAMSANVRHINDTSAQATPAPRVWVNADSNHFSAGGRLDRDNLTFDGNEVYNKDVQDAIDAVKKYFDEEKKGSYKGEFNRTNRVINQRMDVVWDNQVVELNSLVMHLPFSKYSPLMAGEVYDNFHFMLFPDDPTQTWVLMRRGEMSVELMNKVQFFEDQPIYDIRMMRNSAWGYTPDQVKLNEKTLLMNEELTEGTVQDGHLYLAPVNYVKYYFNSAGLDRRSFFMADTSVKARMYLFSSLVVRYGAPTSYHDEYTAYWDVPGYRIILGTDQFEQILSIDFYDMTADQGK